MPISTTLEMTRSSPWTAPSALLASQNWPMISATVRLRLKPCLPVEQKAQSSAQPACVDTHSVPRSSSGMNTVSTALPLPTSIRNLRVPSSDSLSETTAGGATTAVRRELFAQAPGDVGHGVEIRHAGTMHPAQHLARAEGLFALLGEPGGQAFGIEIQQIDGHAALVQRPE